MLKFDWLCKQKVNSKSHILRTSWEDTISWVFCNAKSDLMGDWKLNILQIHLPWSYIFMNLLLWPFFLMQSLI
jgi:hypothetical protein